MLSLESWGTEISLQHIKESYFAKYFSQHTLSWSTALQLLKCWGFLLELEQLIHFFPPVKQLGINNWFSSESLSTSKSLFVKFIKGYSSCNIEKFILKRFFYHSERYLPFWPLPTLFLWRFWSLHPAREVSLKVISWVWWSLQHKRDGEWESGIEIQYLITKHATAPDQQLKQ